jgi:2'-5' RNA ligase
MPYAVTLTLDDLAATRVRRLWRIVDDSGHAPSVANLDYPPHVTLARFQDLDPLTTADVIDTFAAGLSALTVHIDRLATFERPSPVLFLGTAENDALLAFHARLAALLGDANADPHTRSGHWVPHVTLSTALPEGDARLRLQRTIADAFKPFDATLAKIELVRFPPVRVLNTTPLDGRHGAVAPLQ